jgi:hypothetical protein
MLGGPQSRPGRRGEENIFTLPGLELRPLGRPARSQSLYRLRMESSEGQHILQADNFIFI